MVDWDIGKDEAAEACSEQSDEDVATTLLAALAVAGETFERSDMIELTASFVRDIRRGEQLRMARDAE